MFTEKPKRLSFLKKILTVWNRKQFTLLYCCFEDINAKKNCKKIKLSFWIAENIVFLFIALFCMAVLIYTYFIECEIMQNIIMSIATSVLASVMIPFCLNVGKTVREKRILDVECKSIISNSLFLIERLKNYIAPKGKKPFSSYSDLRNRKILSTVDFANFETIDELFSIILAKLARIDKMEYINKTDAFVIEKHINQQTR